MVSKEKCYPEGFYPCIVGGDTLDGYFVSYDGKVYSSKSKKFLKEADNGAGYKLLRLMVGGVSKAFYIHRLVAEALVTNQDNKSQVGHKDHNRANNHVDNLYWCTPSENTRDGIRDGRINSKKRGKTNQLTPADICEVARLRYFGNGIQEIANIMGFPRTTISSVVNGRSNSELYKFAYSEIESHYSLTLFQNNLPKPN